jgi:hypothetical protein
MARPAGSKNKIKEKIDELISEVRAIDADESEKQDVIDELDDLLSSVPEDKNKLIGYHPITGAEIWE